MVADPSLEAALGRWCTLHEGEWVFYVLFVTRLTRASPLAVRRACAGLRLLRLRQIVAPVAVQNAHSIAEYVHTCTEHSCFLRSDAVLRPPGAVLELGR